MTSVEPVAAPPPLLIQGLRFLEAGDAAAADAVLQKFLAAGDHPDGHNLAGAAKRALGDIAAARHHLARAVAMVPDEAIYAVNLAMLLSDQGERERALGVLEPPLRKTPGHLDAALARAQILQSLGRIDEAIAGARMAAAFNREAPRAHFALGLMLLKAGQPQAAADSLLAAAERDPAHVDAWLNAGVALKEAGNFPAAESSYRRAIALAPKDASAHNNLGNLLSLLGRHDEAFATFRTALALDPAYVEAKANLAMAYREAGDPAAAVPLLEEALAQRPHFVPILNMYGNTLRLVGRIDDAIGVLEDALSRDPNFAEAHNNLGLAYALAGRMKDAARHMGRAVALRPDSAVMSTNYGALLLRMYRFEEAIDVLRKVLARDPENEQALVNIGICHYMLGQASDAIAAYRAVLANNPDSSFGHYSLGVSYLEDQRLSEAEAEIRRSLVLDPTNALAHNTLGVLLLDQHQIGAARAEMLAAADMNTVSAPIFYSNYAFASLYEAEVSNAEILDIHKEFGRRFATAVTDPARPHANARDPDRKLRLAYLSPDFRAHSVAYFFEALLEKHDRSRFDVLLYSETTRKDAVTAAMKKAADAWIESGGLTNEELAQRIAADGIDILVNLGGHTSGNRLPACALRPAPVQIEYLGYPETSGVPAMQYRLTDAHADPPGEAERWCTEELVRLPHCFHCYRPYGQAPDVAPAPHVTAGHVTFASFNVLPKVTETVIATWAEILRQVPHARFYIKCKQMRDERNQARLRDLFRSHAVDPERVTLDAFVPSVRDHLDKYAQVDLALDPFPYNGTTTSCEAMWMGVPVLSIRGDNHRSRVGYSLLHAVGLDDMFAVPDRDAYVARAVALGRDPAPLAEVRRTLRDRMAASPLRDEVGFTRTLEQTYRDLWRRWCAGPETFMLKRPDTQLADDSIQGVLVKTL